MKNLKKPQLIFIAVAVFIFVLILLLPRVEESSDSERPETTAVEEVNHDHDLSDADQNSIDFLSARIEEASDPLTKIEWLDSLSNFWQSIGLMHESANALYRIAEILDDKPSYFIAGDKYFEAFRSEENHDQLASLKMAIESYSKVLEKNPDDLEAKTSLAVCYVEGSQLLGEAPMKGIGMLKEVLEKDPDNINALINLGYFAVQSGQLDKAIERFQHVISIDENYLDAYLYLSDVYLKKGDKEKAISNLEAFKSRVDNPEVEQQLDVYIEKIKTNNI